MLVRFLSSLGSVDAKALAIEPAKAGDERDLTKEMLDTLAKDPRFVGLVEPVAEQHAIPKKPAVKGE